MATSKTYTINDDATVKVKITDSIAGEGVITFDNKVFTADVNFILNEGVSLPHLHAIGKVCLAAIVEYLGRFRKGLVTGPSDVSESDVLVAIYLGTLAEDIVETFDLQH